MLLTILALQAAAATIENSGEIIVSATSIREMERQQSACRRDRCSVKNDVALSVTYASVLFDEGQYMKARNILISAIDRNAHALEREPQAIGLLYMSFAKLEIHEGNQDAVEKSFRKSILAFSGQGQSPGAILNSVRINFADWLAQRGRLNEALELYNIVGKAFPERDGAAALLRKMTVLVALGRKEEAAAGLDKLVIDGDFITSNAARAALVRIGQSRETSGGFHNTTVSFESEYIETPHLLSQPPFPDPIQNVSSKIDLKWVNITYLINPDGHVTDIDPTSGSQAIGWIRPIINYLSKCRYTVTKYGTWRTERFTYTGDYHTAVGSLIRRRMFKPRFERTRLADQPAR